MGKEFGGLQRLYGVTYYVLSPYEVKPFTGILNPGIRNTLRRFRESALFVAYPFVMFYFIRDWANAKNEALHRKNPQDYVNEE